MSLLRSVVLIIALAQVSQLFSETPLRLIAHRGGVVDETRIENNVTAIQEAIRQGYWMLEVDIRETKDGHPVVHHDGDFARYYGDKRRVKDMSLAEIRQLRSTPGGLRPLTFAEYVASCRGKIRLMLDVKENHHEAFYVNLRNVLSENDLLDSCYVLGSSEAKQYFKNDASVSINGQELRAVVDKGNVPRRCFLFGIAAKIDKSLIKLANQHEVTVVPAINTFRYEAARHHEQAASDIQRLRALGVSHFQIDSIYGESFGKE